MKKIFYILVFGINLFSLPAKSFADEKGEKKMNLETLVLNEKIDIKYKQYIHSLKPWINGKITTIDGWGNFASFEVVAGNRIKITPLTNFPGTKIDGVINTFPEIGIIKADAYENYFVYFYDNETGKNIVTTPWSTRKFFVYSLFVLHNKEKTFVFQYRKDSLPSEYLIYDLLNEKVVFNSFENPDVTGFKGKKIVYSFGDGKFLCEEISNDKCTGKHFLYDYDKDEVIINKFTELLSGRRYSKLIKLPEENTFIIVYDRLTEKGDDLIVECGENFEKLNISFLIPPVIEKNGKVCHVYNVSSDGNWAVVTASGYKGLKNEELKKYCFINLKKGSPYYSIPVVTDEYYGVNPRGQFLTHPIYGICYVEKIKIQEEEYIRMYKMSDVEKVIESKFITSTESMNPSF